MPRHKRKKQPDVWQQDRQGVDRTKVPPRHNELFVKYYQGQKFVPEGEWEDFYQTLKDDLPVTFRITGSRRQATQLLRILKEQFLNNLTNLTVNDKTLPPPKCLPWYPDQLAWHIDTTKKAVRQNTLLKKLHTFLIAETESGNISRQEAVSMIPPLLLDVRPHHKILDMCAAPGSKTAQLIEYLHADESKPVPDGFVVANDVDNKRCYMMVHQVKRLGSPNCMVVNENAYSFPKLRKSKEGEKLEFYLFDRVLADVPCSGDGTVRKNPDVWGKWKPIMGHNMHGLQLKILKRGLELLSDGGRLVYSTCSFNPIEDEAVIAEMLRKSEGAIEILDVSNKLPGLKSVSGLQTWKCMDRFGCWHESMKDLPDNLVNQFMPSMFPPTAEEQNTFKLDRCVRVLPHHQNTGGFFICVLQKLKHLPWMKAPKVDLKEPVDVKTTSPVVNKEDEVSGTVNEMTENTEEKADTTTELKTVNTAEDVNVNHEVGATETTKRKAEEDDFIKQKQKKFKGYKEDPFLFVEADDPMWSPINDFYQIPESFPREQVLYRSEQGKKKTLYFVSAALKNVVECNCERIRFINMGVKFLSRSASPLVKDCDFRITQESLAILSHIYKSRTIDITKQDVEIILSQENPYALKFSESVQTKLSSLCPGSIVLRYRPTESDPFPDCELLFCAWRGNVCIRSFVPKFDRQHFLHLFGLDINDIRAKLAENKPKHSEESKNDDSDCLGNGESGEKVPDISDVMDDSKDVAQQIETNTNELDNYEIKDDCQEKIEIDDTSTCKR